MNFIDKLIKYVKQFLAIEPIEEKKTPPSKPKVKPKKVKGLNPKKKKTKKAK